MSGQLSDVPANIVKGATNLFVVDPSRVPTSAELSAVFYILIIFFAVYLLFSLGFWSKITMALGSQSGFVSHLDNSPAGPMAASTGSNPSVNITSANQNALVSYGSVTSPWVGLQGVSGFAGGNAHMLAGTAGKAVSTGKLMPLNTGHY